MRIIVLLTLVLAYTLAPAATGYRSVDPSGEVIFSDKPSAGAQPIDIPDAQTYEPGSAPATPAPTTAAPKQDKAKSSPAAVKQVEAVPYESLTVVQPGDKQTLTYRPDGIPVVVSLTPALQKGHQIVLTLDGEEVGRGTALAVNVPNVYRGAHSVSAKVIDETGNTLISSPSVTFYVIQHSILEK